jgi:hypothetical protein
MLCCHVCLNPFVDKFLAEVLGQFVHLFTKIIYFQSVQNLLGMICNKLVSLLSFDAGVDKFGNIMLGIPA